MEYFNLDEEISRLKKVSDYIQKEEDKLHSKIEERKQSIIDDKVDIYKTINTEDIVDLANRRIENEESIARSQVEEDSLKRLKEMEDSPYFAGLIFHEEGESKEEKIYIGFQGLRTDDYENLVYDWRAPIASLYYDNGLGHAEFTVPNVGSKIQGENKAKAQIIIKNKEIQDIFLTDDSLNEDALLYELSQNTSSSMKNIVSTIQKEQNNIIRHDKKEDLIIQGVAGSGKTSVALHKIAYLLYQNRGTLSWENFLLLAPSKEFATYISKVLPEMGEEMIPVMQFEDIALKNLPPKWRAAIETKADFTRNLTDEAYRARYLSKAGTNAIKLLLDFATTIKEYNLKDKDLYFKGFTFKKEKINNIYQQRKSLPIRSQISLIAEICFDEIKHKFKKNQDIMAEELEKAVGELFYYKNLKKLWLAFKKYSSKHGLSFNEEQLEYGDLFLLAGLKLLLRKPRKFNEKIKYLIIDEMQDYSGLQYWYIRAIFPKQEKLILGDEDQQLLPGGSTRKDILQIFPQAVEKELNISYRSTKEIIDFARNFTSNHIESINRSRKEVEKIGTENLGQLLRSQEAYTQALIVPINYPQENFEKLKEKYESGNTKVLTSLDAKGLEFDLVVLVDFFDEKGNSKEADNEVYVATTRATKELYILEG